MIQVVLAAEAASQALHRSGERLEALASPVGLPVQQYSIASTPYSRYGGEIGEMGTAENVDC